MARSRYPNLSLSRCSSAMFLYTAPPLIVVLFLVHHDQELSNLCEGVAHTIWLRSCDDHSTCTRWGYQCACVKKEFNRACAVRKAPGNETAKRENLFEHNLSLYFIWYCSILFFRSLCLNMFILFSKILLKLMLRQQRLDCEKRNI